MAGMSKLSDVTTALGVRNLQASGDPKVLAEQGLAPAEAPKAGDLTIVGTPAADQRQLDTLRKARRRFSILGNDDGPDTLG